MPDEPRYSFVECVGESRQLRLAVGANRIAVTGLRPQAEDLIRYMIGQSESADGDARVYSHEELHQAIWGRRRIANQRAQLARLVFEIRQVLGPSTAGEPLIATAPGKGYVLKNAGLRRPSQSSPFVCGPPIAQPSGFFGREAELKRIFGLWSRFPLQNIALIGPRRSGKTSLLHYLERIHLTPANQLRPNQARHWHPGLDGHRVVFIDFQDARLRTPAAVLRRILEQLGMTAPNPCSPADFAEAVSRISCRTILLFDEFEVALFSPDFDAGFWAGLRSLGTNYTKGMLGFVIALHREPSATADPGEAQSPFLNIFGHTISLGPLEKAEALELIRSSPREFSAEDVDWILRESGGHPCLLQLLCDTRLTALEEQQLGEEWKTGALARIRRFGHLLGRP